jgi:hypothetical protein
MDAIKLAKYFGFDLIDYDRSGDSILIASGSGLMMAIMDVCPRFKYCIDIDNFREIANRIPQLISAFDLNCEVNIIGIAGWFSIDNPEQLIIAQKKIKQSECIAYSGGYNYFINENHTLKEFIESVNYG